MKQHLTHIERLKTISDIFIVMSVILLFLTFTSCSITPEPEPSAINKAEITATINEARQTESIPPVTWDAIMQSAAEMQSAHMAETGWYEHTWEDGTSLLTRMNSLGFRGNAAENIAWNFDSQQRVIEAWMGSECHRYNIMNPKFTDFGMSRTGNSWCFVIGKEMK